jgi:glycosyltransferase involved in cell wall biosynthesis
MISVLCRIPVAWDATALYRSTGPFNHIRTVADFTFKESQNYNWVVIGSHDCVFMQRPFTEQDLQLAHLTKRCNKPLVIDYDDDLLSVPEHNPAHKFYSSQRVHQQIKQIIGMADQVIVSTEALAKKYNEFRQADPCVVIPNAFPDHMVPFVDSNIKRQNVITWRGSNTHNLDLRTMHPVIKIVVKEYPNWKFVFFGDPDWDTLNLIPKDQRHVVATQDPIDYLDSLKKVGSTVHMVPLEDNEFNRSKSNIAWIEATFAGAATIAPNWLEWQKTGVLNYSSNEEMAKQLVSILDKPESAQAHVFASRDEVPLTRKLAKDRIDVFIRAIGR